VCVGSPRGGTLASRDKAATFEGRTPQGVVTDDLVDFHVALAEGGVDGGLQAPTWTSGCPTSSPA
jgi:hypothetical protein